MTTAQHIETLQIMAKVWPALRKIAGLPTDSPRVMAALDAAVTALQGRALAAKAPTAQSYFSFTDQNDFQEHGTLAEAEAAAARAFEFCRDEAAAESSWPETVDYICYGQIIGRVVETDRTPWDEAEHGPPPAAGCEHVEYALIGSTGAEAQPVAWPDGLLDRVKEVEE